MNKLVLALLVLFFSCATANAAVPVIENLDGSDEAVALEFLGGANGPAAVCEGPAICRQTDTCTYRCFGPAKGTYDFADCSGEVALAFCLFRGGADACAVRCIPNPF